jgi:hypothetical protein
MKKLIILAAVLLLSSCTIQPIQPQNGLKKSYNRIYHNASGKVIRLDAQSITIWDGGLLVVIDGDAYFIRSDDIKQLEVK